MFENGTESGIRFVQGPARRDLLTVITWLLILFALAGPDVGFGGDRCPPPPGSAPVHLDVGVPGDAPCDSETPCPADEGCTTCATCCKVAVRSLPPQIVRAAGPPDVPRAVTSRAVTGPRGSV
jgi:hypothetical protein